MNIVILGAGYAGLRTALDLDRRIRERGLDSLVTLIDQNPYHQLIQEIHLTATAGIDSLDAIYDIRHLLNRHGVRFIQGRVREITPLNHEVHLEDGQSLTYDRLVLALGSETAYYDIPGAREHSYALRTYDDAIALRDHIIAQFTAAAAENDPKRQRQLLTTAIVGGGFTGCQIAGELPAWADKLCKETGAPRSEVRIALLDHNKLLLKQFGNWASREAERALDQRGVSIYLETAVNAVEPGLIRVSGGRVLRAGTIIWAAGIRAPGIIAAAGITVDRAGRAIVDRYLRVEGQSAIFALGDCASIPSGADGATVLATASYAMRQGEYLGGALFSEILGEPLRAYEPIRLGQLVSIGPDYGVGNPLGMPLLGYPVILMKKGVEQYYRASIEGA
ncbi:NAD(P)/FAD-dependent oxidoreductase [Chloroflexales bacterium ZM16-3]|nr:NAD(P)/FAD-dependent oxidoreductase [Chloroflexales bacterium ZM16-3]